VEQELRYEMSIGMSQFHLGADLLIRHLPSLDVFVDGVRETEFPLEDRANLLEALFRFKPRVYPREIASVHDQVSNNPVA